jgi:hypothetical protein
VRSLAIKCSACAGLYVAGRGLRIDSSKTVNPTQLPRSVLKTNRLGAHIKVASESAHIYGSLTELHSENEPYCKLRGPSG